MQLGFVIFVFLTVTTIVRPNVIKDAFVTTFNCIVYRGWEDATLGSFMLTKDYCDPKCDRSIPCCAPMKPKDIKIKYLLSNHRVNDQLIDGKNRNSTRHLSPSKVVFVVHGYFMDIRVENYFNETRDAWLKHGVNVIVVDWQRGNHDLFLAFANVRIVGALLGRLIQELGVASRSTCVGFSLGAHVCGEAGKWLTERNLRIANCVGLDPGGDGYDGCSDHIRLDKDDCDVVGIIHTSQFYKTTEMLGLGTIHKSGHCDFWINHGYRQPGCSWNVVAALEIVTGIAKGKNRQVRLYGEELVICSHIRSIQIYNQQLRGECNFIGKQAKKCDTGKKCQVIPNGTTMRLSPFDECSSNMDVNYYVESKGPPKLC